MKLDELANEMYEKYVLPYSLAKDEINFINSLNLKIDDKEFKLTEYQENFILQKYLHKHVVVYKSRQSGYTTAYLLHMLYILHLMFIGLLDDRGGFLFISPNRSMNNETKKHLDWFAHQVSIRELLPERQDDFMKYVKKQVVFTTPSDYMTSTCSKCFREEYIDEFAFVEYFENVVKYTAPQLSSIGTTTFVTSFGDESITKIDRETSDRLFSKGEDVAIIETKWYEIPEFNKNLMWKKIVCEPTIDAEGNVKYDKEAWDKKIADGWIPTSPRYEKLCEALGEKTTKELLN